VREGRLSATSLVTESLRRLDAAASLNVVSELAADEALHEARRIDDGTRAPARLLGAPLLIKDLEDWRGHPTTKGSLALRDSPAATENATVPGRLLAEGAVALGKSTLPEFAIESYSANLLTGVTRNPWNPDYSPGGSSGGSASALAAGLVLIGTATDGGGSVRIPASLCGLVGLKPTNGVIGRWPTPDWIDYSTDGPLATSCDDLELLFDVMRGPTAGDPTAPTVAMNNTMVRHRGQPVTLFAAERTSPLGALPHDVAVLFADAVAAVSELLKVPVEWKSPEEFFFDGNPDLDWFTTCTAEHVNALGREWVLANMDTFHVATKEFLEVGLRVSVDEYLDARRRRYRYVRTMDQLLGENGLLLTPSVTSSGWLADGRMTTDAEVHGLAPALNSTAMQNVTGLPAISVPMGHFSNSLPFGLQLTGRHYDDLRLIDLASVLEDAYPWPRTATGYPGLETLLNE
jgi:Asp-tRNA(Asn)/Glu-tRNA(Gln) amidotransferase A subunit family amidase